MTQQTAADSLSAVCSRGDAFVLDLARPVRACHTHYGPRLSAVTFVENKLQHAAFGVVPKRTAC